MPETRPRGRRAAACDVSARTVHRVNCTDAVQREHALFGKRIDVDREHALRTLRNLRVADYGRHALRHQPLALLHAIERVRRGGPRWLPYPVIAEELRALQREFAEHTEKPRPSVSVNVLARPRVPAGDGAAACVWEIEDYESLEKDARRPRDVPARVLTRERVRVGLGADFADMVASDAEFARRVVRTVLDEYFPAEMRDAVMPSVRRGAGRFLTRLCWNSAAWRVPTGEAARAESGTYAVEHGVGHEEWLGRHDWLVDGEWRYGFLQGVNSSRAARQGQVVDVTLFSRPPDGGVVYVGRLHRGEILTADQAREAVTAAASRGWLETMRADVARVGGSETAVDTARPELIFNVRFRPGDLEWFVPHRAAGGDDPVQKMYRYTLARWPETARPDEGETVRNGGAHVPLPADAIERRGTPPCVVDPYHNRIQNRLCELLSEKYGPEAVRVEERRVDLRVRHRHLDALVEVKSNASAVRAIREAIGQLFEYALHRPADAGPRTVLVIAAPGELTDGAAAFLARLNDVVARELRYVAVTEFSEQCPL